MSHPDDDITMRECLMRDIQDLTAQRDEARKAFAIATTTCVDAQQRLRQLELERDEARADHDHLITISRDRLEKIRQLEREIETLRPSNLPPLS